ncbi:PAS domain-containing protein [Rhodococcus sp. T7]|uniref:PAS domain-containing protein n=1 Tax=Rhodococcus sp. T7 TaxID=627444 RepID=UPI00135B1D92
MLIANPASAALVGYRVEQLVGDYEWLLLPSDTPRWRRFLRDMHGAKAPRSTFFHLRHRSGDWLWAHAAAAEFTVGGALLIAVTWKDCSTDLCGPAGDLPGLTRCLRDRYRTTSDRFGSDRTVGSRSCQVHSPGDKVKYLEVVYDVAATADVAVSSLTYGDHVPVSLGLLRWARWLRSDRRGSVVRLRSCPNPASGQGPGSGVSDPLR